MGGAEIRHQFVIVVPYAAAIDGFLYQMTVLVDGM